MVRGVEAAERELPSLQDLGRYQTLGVAPPAALRFEESLRRMVQLTHGRSLGALGGQMIQEAHRAISAYRELFTQPSQMDLAYRNELLGTLDGLERRLTRLERSYSIEGATAWLADYNHFKAQIGDFVSEATHDDTLMDRIVRGLRIFSRVTAAVTAASLIASPAVAVAVGALGAGARIVAEVTDTLWTGRQRLSQEMDAGGGGVATAAFYLRQLGEGLKAAIEGTRDELPQR